MNENSKRIILETLALILGKNDEEITCISMDEALITYGLDSLKFMQLIVLLEEAMDIEILDSDLSLEKFLNLQMIYNTMEKYIHE